MKEELKQDYADKRWFRDKPPHCQICDWALYVALFLMTLVAGKQILEELDRWASRL